MTISILRHSLFASACVTCLLIAPVATGQTVKSASDTGVATLEEVVVTANKRTENIQKVPVSVAVASQAALQTQNITDTSALTRLVPSVTFNQSFLAAANVFSVRGVGTNAGGVGVEQSVGVAYDGVPLGSAAGSVSDLVDISRVEVLKGPQGMLFGKNASAGLINIVSNAPKLGKTEEIGRVSYGTLNDQQYTGTINVPLGEDAALRVSGWKFKRDGTVLEVNTGQKFNDKNTQGARLKLLWDPTPNLVLNLTGEWSSRDQNGAAYTIRSYNPANFTQSNSGAAIQNYDLNTTGQHPGPNNKRAYDLGNTPYYDRGSSAAYTLQADYSIGGGTITTIGSYRHTGVNESSAPYPSSNPYSNQPFNFDNGGYDQYTGEIHYASPSRDRLHYVAGLFFFHEHLKDNFELGVTAQFLPSVDNLSHQFQTNNNYAAFGEATFDVTSDLHLIGGLRQSHDDVKGSINRVQLNNPTIVNGWNAPGNSFGTLSESANSKYDFTSWQAGVQYQVKPDAMIYATATKGYKGPGIIYNVGTNQADLAAANNGVVKPEIATSYELGLKSQWFDRRLTVNVALYDETFDNFQTTSPSAASVVDLVVVNAPQLKSDGVDLDVVWQVTPAFTLTAATAYADARFTDYSKGQCYGASDPQCVAGYKNMTGKPLFNSPKWTTNIDARYEVPLSNGMHAFVDANDGYKTKQYFEAAANPYEYQGAYNILNVSTGVRAPDSRWGLTLAVDNVMDTHFVGAELQQQGVFIGQIIGYDAMRSVHVALDVKF